MSDGSLTIYEGVPDLGATARAEMDGLTCGLRFVKRHVRAMGTMRVRQPINGANDGPGQASRRFSSFANFGGYQGCVLTGDQPVWLMAEDASPIMTYDSSLKPIFGLSELPDGFARDFTCLISNGEVSSVVVPACAPYLHATSILGHSAMSLSSRVAHRQGSAFH